MPRLLQKLIVGGGESWLSANWWDEINNSVEWQDGIFYSLCSAYAAVALVALIQIIRSEVRVPELGMTTQKLFHLMNFVVSALRAIVFGFHKKVFLDLPYKVLTLALLDLPGLLFFSTYTLIVLFWADIYYQARDLPTDVLRFFYASINAGIYTVQGSFWVYIWNYNIENDVVDVIGKMFIAAVSCMAALGFLVYGGRLYFMLKWFPIEHRGKRRKLHEVGSVTVICFSCFLVRCFVVAASAFNYGASVDVLNHPVLNLVYYTTVEILPSILVLYILRKLPRKRVPADYRSSC